MQETHLFPCPRTSRARTLLPFLSFLCIFFIQTAGFSLAVQSASHWFCPPPPIQGIPFWAVSGGSECGQNERRQDMRPLRLIGTLKFCRRNLRYSLLLLTASVCWETDDQRFDVLKITYFVCGRELFGAFCAQPPPPPC